MLKYLTLFLISYQIFQYSTIKTIINLSYIQIIINNYSNNFKYKKILNTELIKIVDLISLDILYLQKIA